MDDDQEVQSNDDLNKLAEKAEKPYQFEQDCTSSYNTVNVVSTNRNKHNKSSLQKKVK